MATAPETNAHVNALAYSPVTSLVARSGFSRGGFGDSLMSGTTGSGRVRRTPAAGAGAGPSRRRSRHPSEHEACHEREGLGEQSRDAQSDRLLHALEDQLVVRVVLVVERGCRPHDLADSPAPLGVREPLLHFDSAQLELIGPRLKYEEGRRDDGDEGQDRHNACRPEVGVVSEPHSRSDDRSEADQTECALVRGVQAPALTVDRPTGLVEHQLMRRRPVVVVGCHDMTV